jgi:heat-inducible transcriptional repressor
VRAAGPLVLTTVSMLDERKSAILRAVVEEYIDTAQPVGSSHVANAPGVDVSSATVRNEMAGLEADGYLRQPHTSAGRVPTEKGYRFFVDHLRRPARLPGPSAEEVRDFFARAHGEAEQMLAQTSRLLSNLTNLTGVVVAPGPA